jgi:DNA polymerase I-like protein with 3'-5' exonuclease and polymerase domains
MFDALRAKVQKTGVLSLDLETDSKVPADVTELKLIALAAGSGRGIKALAVKPSKKIIRYTVDCLRNPELRLVGHNVISYDLEVLQHQGIIDLKDVRAKLADTLVMSWLVNENIQHKLKFLAKRYLGVTMVEFSEAYLESPALRKIRSLDAILKQNEIKIISLDKRLARLKNPVLLAESQAQKDILTANNEDMAADKVLLNLRAETEQRRYAADDARQTLKLYYHFRKIIIEKGWATWAGVELKARRYAAMMEMSGIRIDRGKLNAVRPEFGRLQTLFHNKVLNIAKEDVNPRSPKDMKRLIYDTLGLPAYKMHPDADPEEKTGEMALARMTHPIAQALLDFRVVDKLRGTYVEMLWKKVCDREDSRLYGRFNTTGARTGRFSSSGPNLQNIPSRKKPNNYDVQVQELGPKIRSYFVAPPGRKLIIVDLSQIELRLIAHVTQDTKMLDVYNRHEMENGMKFYTGDIHAETMVNADVPRKMAKNMNFGMCYGITPGGFCRRFKIFKPGTRDYDFDGVTGNMNAFFETYSGLANTIQLIRAMWDGRHGRFPRRHFKMLSGRLRRFTGNDRHSPGAILNAIIQGSAADLLKAITVAVLDQMLSHPDFATVLPLLQIHDELVLEADDDQADDVGVVVKYAMERAWFDLTVPVLASGKVVDSWGDMGNDDIPEIGIMPKSKSIKAAAAMLTEEQEAYAAQYITEVTSYSLTRRVADVLSPEEYERLNG